MLLHPRQPFRTVRLQWYLRERCQSRTLWWRPGCPCPHSTTYYPRYYLSQVYNPDSFDYPTTSGVYQPSFSGGADDFIVTKLSSTGALVHSTYVGTFTIEFPGGIAADNAGNVYVSGSNFTSGGFPTTPGAFQETFAGGIADIVVFKLNPDFSALVYATYIGGSGDDHANNPHSIAIDDDGNAYVIGTTRSFNFPTKNPYQASKAGDWDAFVLKLNPSGTDLIYSTFFGGSGIELGNLGEIVVDTDGNAYVVGPTESADFPTQNAFQPAHGGGRDGFIAKFDPVGGLIYSSYLGGSANDASLNVAIDSKGNAYVVGLTSSSDFPTLDPLQATLGGSFDAFLTKVDPSGSSILFSTYIGGSALDLANGLGLDSSGSVYVGGRTASTDFPTTPGAFQETLAGGFDGFVLKLTINQPPDCSNAAPSVSTLWPPNNKFVPISVTGVTDPDGDVVSINIDTIFQDEPVTGKGPDGHGVGSSTAEVRAERSGNGDGRVYHISYTASDGNGATCSGEVLVGVPHDQGTGSTPTDGGALFDSTML